MPTKLLRKQFLLTDDENKQLEKEAEEEGFSVSNLTRIRHGLKPLKGGGKRANAGKPQKEITGKNKN